MVDIIFRIPGPDVIPSSEMQIHPLRIDIDLSRFVLVCGEFFWPVENFFSPVENFFTGREVFDRSRIFFFFRSR